MSDTLEKEWISYLDNLLHEKAGVAQISECHLAFYAGAVSCLQLISTATLGNEKDGIERIKTLHAELDAFFKKFQAKHN